MTICHTIQNTVVLTYTKKSGGGLIHPSPPKMYHFLYFRANQFFQCNETKWETFIDMKPGIFKILAIYLQSVCPVTHTLSFL